MNEIPDPFPGPNTNTSKSPWVDRFVEAVQADVPSPANEESLRHLGRVAIGVKNLLIRQKDGSFRLRDVEEIETPDGTLIAIRTVVPTPTLVLSPINDRIDYLFQTAGSADTGRPERPSHLVMTGDDGTPGTGIVWTAKSIDEIRSTTKVIADQLERLDGLRSWDLKEDLTRRGQQEPSLAYLGNWTYPNPEDPDELVVVPSIEVTRGNNRAFRAQEALGLGPSTGILGLPRSSYVPGHTKGDRERNWQAGLSSWSTYYNDLRDRPLDDRDPHSVIAHQAYRVATTPLVVVIGSSAPLTLPQSLSATNVGEHLHPPLSFDANAEHTSAFALLAAAYRRAGLIDTVQEAQLTGRLEVGDDGTSLCEAEDQLRRMMLRMVFPVDPDDQKVTRQALSEPARNRLTRTHVERRSRILAAADARIRNAGADVNPRSGEVYVHSDAVSGLTVTDVTLTELLDLAEGGDRGALRHLLRDRAWPLFAVAGLAGADRGSLGEVRRSPRSVVQTLERQPARALGLVREMIDARNTKLNLRPNQVDDTGAVQEGTLADRAWFDEAFPKVGKSAPPDTTPGTDVPDPIQDHLAAQTSLIAAVEGVGTALALVHEEAADLEGATVAAGLAQPMAPDLVQMLVKSLNEARDEIKAAQRRVNDLTLLIDLDEADGE